jgi:hypothetical protein
MGVYSKDMTSAGPQSQVPFYNKKVLFCASLVALFTLLLYLPALQNEFVNLDDPLYVTENPHIRSLNLESFKWMFTSFHASNWHPLTWLSHALDYALWGMNPVGHHLTSIIFHVLNTFLVVILSVSLILCVQNKAFFRAEDEQSSYKNFIIAGVITGLLFGVHPIHVESVAWISERKDVLYAFFFLLSILFYVKYTSSYHKQRKLHYTLSLILFILSLMSKPMAVTLPFVLLILDFYPLKRIDVKSHFMSQLSVLKEKIPFVVLSFGSVIITFIAQQQGGAMTPFDTSFFSDRILVAFKGLVFYLIKIIWPTELSPFYPYPADVSFTALEYMGSVLFVFCMTLFCIVSWKKQKIFLSLWVYYIVTLLPVLGLIRIGGQATADRYAYLPSLGPFFLLGVGFIWIVSQVRGTRHGNFLRKILFTIICLLLLGVLPYLTIKQEAIWKDAVSLWSAELKQFPYFYRAYNNRAEAYMKIGNYQKAIADLNEAIRLNPKEPVGYYNRGIAYGNLERYHKALEDFTQAITLSPQNALYYFDLAITYEQMGSHNTALQLFTKAIDLDPSLQKAYFYRGILYMDLGLYQKAINDLQSAARMGNEQAQRYLTIKGVHW